MKKQAPPEEKGEQAPLWIISFADMISLLMAFFVMLLTMATTKSGMLCNEGLDVFNQTVSSFNAAISNYGIPWLIGKEENLTPNDKHSSRYQAKDVSSPPPAVQDVPTSEIEYLFNKINRQAKTFRSQTEGQYPDFVAAPVMFAKGQATVSEEGKRFLSNFAAELCEAKAGRRITLYVVGLTPEKTGGDKQWKVSAGRAKAVSDFLYGTLPREPKAIIYSWGAGHGGKWVEPQGPAAKGSQILIAVLSEDE